jgi:HAD superfamily hydrolase (TIGR01509 family)
MSTGPRAPQATALEAVIFDFNGVLWWDGDLQTASWRAFSARLRGEPLSDEEMAVHVHGRTNGHTLAYLLGREVSGSEQVALSEAKETIYREMCLAEGEAFALSPGANDLLDALVKARIPRTIATASAWPNVAFFIEHLSLDRWFDPARIVFDDGRRPGKPAPDPYLAAAEALRLPPRACVVVEDSLSGLASAAAAGIGLVVALGPPGEHGRLAAQPGVGAVIEQLGQFPLERLTVAGAQTQPI